MAAQTDSTIMMVQPMWNNLHARLWSGCSRNLQILSATLTLDGFLPPPNDVLFVQPRLNAEGFLMTDDFVHLATDPSGKTAQDVAFDFFDVREDFLRITLPRDEDLLREDLSDIMLSAPTPVLKTDSIDRWGQAQPCPPLLAEYWTSSGSGKSIGSEIGGGGSWKMVTLRVGGRAPPLSAAAISHGEGGGSGSITVGHTAEGGCTPLLSASGLGPWIGGVCRLILAIPLAAYNCSCSRIKSLRQE